MKVSSWPRVKRLVYLVHRWTGIGACLLMALWLVSGVTMLYVGYPKLLPAERLAALSPLWQPDCCVPVETALASSGSPSAVSQIVLTSIAGRPTYRLRDGDGRLHVVDATTGSPVNAIDASAALASARAFRPGASATVMGRIADDRWTHAGGLDPHRPLWRVRVDDAEGTQLYVSSATVEVVMDTTRSERGWNYVGAWLHWLYLFKDGSKDAVWSWLVIALSAVGTLGAATGALTGIWRWRFSGRYKSGARTPYREFQMRWHHITGLVFGTALTLWIFSGLMSMNPFRLFDPAGDRPALAAYQMDVPGRVRVALDARRAMAMLRDAGFDAREIEWRVLAGSPYLLARNAAGRTRLIVEPAGSVGSAMLDRWPTDSLVAAAARLLPQRIRDTELLTAYDAYYYGRGEASMYGAAERRLPVLRVDFDGRGATSAYIDTYTGDVALSVDRSQRLGRWLFNLLHSWDLGPLLNAAALREAMLVALSLGSVAIAITGTVIGWRRLRAVARRRS